MPNTIGTVRCLNISDDAAFTVIAEEGTGDLETLIVWSNLADVPVRTRVMQSNWAAMLREALADNRTVQITTPTNSAIVTMVQVGES
jgi:hypothetical protein